MNVKSLLGIISTETSQQKHEIDTLLLWFYRWTIAANSFHIDHAQMVLHILLRCCLVNVYLRS